MLHVPCMWVSLIILVHFMLLYSTCSGCAKIIRTLFPVMNCAFPTVSLLSCIDAVLDRAITPSTAQYIVWATGPRGTVDGFAYFHTSWPSNLQTTLQFGRRATNNCGALPCSVPPTCPFIQPTFWYGCNLCGQDWAVWRPTGI